MLQEPLQLERQSQRSPNIEMTEYPFNHTEINACMVCVADILGVLK